MKVITEVNAAVATSFLKELMNRCTIFCALLRSKH